jgi:hypothetical protein
VSRRDLRVSDSFEAAERADDEFYASLSPQESLDILLDLIAPTGSQQVKLQKDLREFIELLNSRGTDHIVHARFRGEDSSCPVS